MTRNKQAPVLENAALRLEFDPEGSGPRVIVNKLTIAFMTGALCACVLAETEQRPNALTPVPFQPAPEGQAAPGTTRRLYDGMTAFVANPDGRDFTLALDVRDLNTGGEGLWDGFLSSEMLVKIYAPDGRTLVRQVIPDDGIEVKSPPVPLRGWYCIRGTRPTTTWSASSAPARLAAMMGRSFTCAVKGGGAGVYRIVLVGTTDHYVTLRLDPSLKYGVAGHNDSLHGHGDLLRASYIYVPRGAIGLYLKLLEYDQPETRRFTLTAPNGTKIFDGSAGDLQEPKDHYEPTVTFKPPNQHDDQVLKLEVSEGSGDYLVRFTFLHGQLKSYHVKLGGAVPAVLAPDPETARAVQGGAIYHDGLVFWYPFQTRYHDWLKALKPEDLTVRDAAGKEIPLVQVAGMGPRAGHKVWYFDGLPRRDGFLPLSGVFNPPPICDGLMHNYPAHRNRQALNVAIQDLFSRPTQVGQSVISPVVDAYASDGLRNITIGDHTAVNGPEGYLSYHFGTWGWPYWRAAWRIAQEPDVPEEVRSIVREALLICGDRLAFARGSARIAGNAFAGLVEGLRYACEGTKDPLQKELFDTYFQRFISEGFGERTGIGPSGDCQENFGHDNHYGAYILQFWNTVVADLHDERFKAVLNRIVQLYTYLWCKDAHAYPWSSRTTQAGLGGDGFKPLGVAWKGDPGPDFTVGVNGTNEWFAARRKGYYVVTFHGRLPPIWLGESWGLRQGYGGGCICQLTVPGKGPVLASTLNGAYGKDMELWKWRNFRLHSVVGEMHDGRPLVTADSEHLDASQDGNTVSSSGEVRDCPVRATRTYVFGDADIACQLQLGDTKYHPMTGVWPSKPEIKLAYEAIPFVPEAKVSLIGADGKPLGELTAEAREAKTIVIDCGGYGIRVELEQPSKVLAGPNHVVWVQLVDKPTMAGEVSLRYRLAPFGAP